MVTLYRSGDLTGTVVDSDAPAVAYDFDAIAASLSLPVLRSQSVYFCGLFSDAFRWCSQRIYFGGNPNVYSVEIDSLVYSYSVGEYNAFVEAHNKYAKAVNEGRHAEITKWYDEMVKSVKLYHESKKPFLVESDVQGPEREILLSKSEAENIKHWALVYEPVLI